MSPDASRFPSHSLKIEKVKEHIGAIVTGIDLAQPIDDRRARSSTTLPSKTWSS